MEPRSRKSAAMSGGRGARGRAPESGSRRQRRPANSQGTSEILDKLLTRRMSISLSGQATQVSVLEAIVLQLMQEAMAGNARAWQAILKYQEFAHHRSGKSPELKFEENNYTRAFAKSFGENSDG
jgi:hypothetical protein